MGYLDPRLYQHPKVAALTDRAFRAYVSSLCYCDWLNTRGAIAPGSFKQLGLTPKVSAELVAANLLELRVDEETGEIMPGLAVHNWTERNGTRDKRRESNRRRQQEWRDRQKAARGNGYA